jgi:hypothetical protein
MSGRRSLTAIAAAPLMAMLMIMSANHVVREFTLPLYLRVVGWTATAVMSAASVAFLASMAR